MFDINKIQSKIEEKGINDSEVFYRKKQQKEIELESQEVKYVKETNREGVAIRVLANQKLGFASTNNQEKIQETIKSAISNSKINKTKLNNFQEPSSYPEVKKLFDPAIKEIKPKELIKHSEELINSSNNENVKPTSGSITATVKKTEIINSNGVNQKTQTTSINAIITTMARSEKDIATAYNYQTKRSLNEIDFNEIGREAAQTAKNQLNPKKAPTGEVEVVFKPFALAPLLRFTLLKSLSAEEIQKERSRVPEFLDKKIGPTYLEATDDGTLKAGNRSRRFDDEGAPTKKQPIIKNGVLKGVLHNLKTAHRGKEKTTANGFRRSISDSPRVSPTNFVISPKHSYNDLLTENTVIIRSILGAHTSNKVTGDFSLGIKNGYKIKNGKKKPIKQSMVSGNIYELIKNIKAIGNDTRAINSVVTPSIKTTARISS